MLLSDFFFPSSCAFACVTKKLCVPFKTDQLPLSLIATKTWLPLKWIC